MYLSLGTPDDKGVAKSTGSLTIKNFLSHPLIALVFRIEYKAVIPNGTNGMEAQNFTLGWNYHLPNFNVAGEVQDEEIIMDCELGPG